MPVGKPGSRNRGRTVLQPCIAPADTFREKGMAGAVATLENGDWRKARLYEESRRFNVPLRRPSNVKREASTGILQTTKRISRQISAHA